MNFQSYSREELEEKLALFMSDPSMRMKASLTKQLNSLSDQIEKLDIDVKNEDHDKYIDLVIKLSDKGERIAKSMSALSGIESEAGYNFTETIKDLEN